MWLCEKPFELGESVHLAWYWIEMGQSVSSINRCRGGPRTGDPQIIYPDIVIEQRKSFAEMFKAGNTNCPLLDIGWFNKGGYFCIVGQSGFGGAAGVGGGLGVVISLNETNLILLKEAIDHLPPSSGDALPMERKIFFSGIQSNQWFQAIYDRNNVPVEFKHIEKIAGVGMP